MVGTRISRGGTVSWATSPKAIPLDKHPMDKDEFRRLCILLAIKDGGTAGALFGLSGRTCQRYWYGELPPPATLARLLRLAASLKLSHAQLRKLSAPLSIGTPRQAAGTDL